MLRKTVLALFTGLLISVGCSAPPETAATPSGEQARVTATSITPEQVRARTDVDAWTLPELPRSCDDGWAMPGATERYNPGR